MQLAGQQYHLMYSPSTPSPTDSKNTWIIGNIDPEYLCLRDSTQSGQAVLVLFPTTEMETQ